LTQGGTLGACWVASSGARAAWGTLLTPAPRARPRLGPRPRSAEGGEDDAGDGQPLFANGGDGAYEAALAKLASAVHAGGPEQLAGAMLRVLSRLASKAGILDAPEAADAASAEAAAARGAAAGWLQVLQYARLMLQSLPGRRGGGSRLWADGVAGDGGLTMDGMWARLLMPGVVHAAADVRCGGRLETGAKSGAGRGGAQYPAQYRHICMPVACSAFTPLLRCPLLLSC
jgi:hypothetical protein